MFKTTSIALVALSLVACGGSPSEPASSESLPITGGTGGSASIETTTVVESTGGSSAGQAAGTTLSNCQAAGGQEVTTSFVSYGYYDTADGLIKCNNFKFDAPQTVCIYSDSEYQASITNLCATLSPASSCTYKTSMRGTTGTETDYYTAVLYPNMADWQESCRIIGGIWKTQ